ncbi:MAG: CvpA family protein [Bacteroidota bacterium]|nr:CvpA family protein [Bacteroidota bacterium]
MSSLDLALLLVFGFAAFKGMQKGFVSVIFSFLAFILAVLIAMKFTHTVMLWLEPRLEGSPLVPFIAYTLVFMGVLFGVNMLGKLVEGMLKLVQLGCINKLLGTFFGVLKTAFIVSLLFWLMDKAALLPQDTKDNSFFYPLLVPVAPYILEKLAGILPFMKDLIADIGVFFDSIQTQPDGIAD